MCYDWKIDNEEEEYPLKCGREGAAGESSCRKAGKVALEFSEGEASNVGCVIAVKPSV